nr:MAG TPA: hypothetical protein [Caudoviricetes sp.]
MCTRASFSCMYCCIYKIYIKSSLPRYHYT